MEGHIRNPGLDRVRKKHWKLRRNNRKIPEDQVIEDKNETDHTESREDKIIEIEEEFEIIEIKDINPKKFDIIIVTPFFKREKVFKIFLENLHHLKKGGLNLHAILIGSNSIKGEKELVESYDFDYVGYKNSPLSNKWNFGVSKLKLYNFDFLVVLGSDTIVSKNILKRIYKDMKRGEFLIGGVKDAYFYDIKKKKGVYWKGYEKNSGRYGETVGISRFYSKELLEKMDYKLWDDNLPRNLDGNIYKKTQNINWYTTKIHKGEFLIDIKGGEVQLTKFEKFEGCSEMPKLNMDDILNPSKLNKDENL